MNDQFRVPTYVYTFMYTEQIYIPLSNKDLWRSCRYHIPQSDLLLREKYTGFRNLQGCHPKDLRQAIYDMEWSINSVRRTTMAYREDMYSILIPTGTKYIRDYNLRFIIDVGKLVK